MGARRRRRSGVGSEVPGAAEGAAGLGHRIRRGAPVGGMVGAGCGDAPAGAHAHPRVRAARRFVDARRSHGGQSRDVVAAARGPADARGHVPRHAHRRGSGSGGPGAHRRCFGRRSRRAGIPGADAVVAGPGGGGPVPCRDHRARRRRRHEAFVPQPDHARGRSRPRGHVPARSAPPGPAADPVHQGHRGPVGPGRRRADRRPVGGRGHHLPGFAGVDAPGRAGHGQVRRPRAQLHLRRRRHLRRRARRCPRHPVGRGVRPRVLPLLLRGRRGPAAGGQVRCAGAHAGVAPGVLQAVGADVGVPGAAQGPAHDRRPGPWPRVRRGPVAAGVVGLPARFLRGGRPGDARPRHRERPRRAEAARAQARPRRPARRGVRGAAAAAGPRPLRRIVARPADRRGAGRPGGGRVRRPRGRPGAHRVLRIHAPAGAPPAAAEDAPHPHAAAGGGLRRPPLAGTGRGRDPRRFRKLRRRAGQAGARHGPADPDAAQQAVLPPAAQLRRRAGHRHHAAVGRRREAPAGGTRLSLSGPGVRPPHGVGVGKLPQGADPGDAAADADGVGVGHGGAGRRSAQLPQTLRRADGEDVVPPDASRRGRGR